MAGFGGGALDAVVANLTVTSLTDGTATLTGGDLTSLLSVTSTDIDASNISTSSTLNLSQYGAFLTGVNGAGATANILAVDNDGNIDLYSTFKISSLYYEADAGDVTVCNIPVASSVYGTSMSLNFSIDDTKLLEVLATSDGAGGIINPQVVLKNLFVTDNVYSQTVVATDTTFTSVVKAKHLLEGILFYNTTANAATLDLGTVATGNDVFINKVIAASTWTYLHASDLSKQFFSTTADTTLYLNDDDGGSSWNSGSFTVYFITKKLVR